MRLTALWWWIDRWRKSTAYMDLTLEEQGAYRNLLDEAHLRGGAIPNDPRVLERACGDVRAWKRVQARVMARFQLTPDGWRNETLDTVIHESIKRAEKQQHYRNRRGNEHGNAAGNEPVTTPVTDQWPLPTSIPPSIPLSPSPSPSPSVLSSKERTYVRVSSPNTPTTDDALAQRAGQFVARYAELYAQHRKGARYISKPNLDFLEAVELCRTWGDARLDQIATVFLNSNHDFAEKGSRTMAQFRSMASWCDSRLMEKGIV